MPYKKNKKNESIIKKHPKYIFYTRILSACTHGVKLFNDCVKTYWALYTTFVLNFPVTILCTCHVCNDVLIAKERERPKKSFNFHFLLFSCRNPTNSVSIITMNMIITGVCQ